MTTNGFLSNLALTSDVVVVNVKGPPL